MNAKHPWHWPIRGLILFSLSLLQANASAQITVGYRNPIGVSVNRSFSQKDALKNGPRVFEVSAINVIPVDGTLIYTEDTTFKILDQDKPFSLNILDSNQIKTFESRTRVESASAGRTEAVFTVVGGPAASAVPQSPFAGQTRSSDFLDPTPNFSVFGP